MLQARGLTFILLVCLLLLANCQTGPDFDPIAAGRDDGRPAIKLRYEPGQGYIDPDTGMRYARLVDAGFVPGKPRYFRTRGLGYGLVYQSEAMVVSLYMYDLNQPIIPEGADSIIVQTEMNRVEQDLLAKLKAKSRYDTIHFISREVRPLAPDESNSWPLMQTSLLLCQKGTHQFYESVYLTGFQNHFFKIRITARADRSAGQLRKEQLYQESNLQDLMRMLAQNMAHASKTSKGL